MGRDAQRGLPEALRRGFRGSPPLRRCQPDRGGRRSAALGGAPPGDAAARPGRRVGPGLAARGARCAEGRSLYLLGGNEGVGEEAARRLVDRWPSLRIAGTSSPRVSSEPTEAELASILGSLKQAEPDLIYVALGAPKEERLIAALRTELPRAWWIGVGVSLSFIAGDIRRAPPWMQRTGLEWVHRLVQEPRRLARRYSLPTSPSLSACWRLPGGAGGTPGDRADPDEASRARWSTGKPVA